MAKLEELEAVYSQGVADLVTALQNINTGIDNIGQKLAALKAGEVVPDEDLAAAKKAVEDARSVAATELAKVVEIENA